MTGDCGRGTVRSQVEVVSRSRGAAAGHKFPNISTET